MGAAFVFFAIIVAGAAYVVDSATMGTGAVIGVGSASIGVGDPVVAGAAFVGYGSTTESWTVIGAGGAILVVDVVTIGSCAPYCAGAAVATGALFACPRQWT